MALFIILNEFIYPITSVFYVLIMALFLWSFGEESLFGLRLMGGIIDSLSAVILFLLIVYILNKSSNKYYRYSAGLIGSLSYAGLSTVALVNTQGMETSIYVFCIALFFLFLS